LLCISWKELRGAKREW